MKPVFASALLMAAFGMGLNAAAATAGETKVEVSYAGLDLSDAAGREVLLAKLDTAAHRICGPEPLMADRLREGERYDNCVRETVDRAMASLPRNVAAEFETPKPIHEASLR